MLTEHEYALAEYIMYSIQYLPLYLVDKTFAVLTELINSFMYKVIESMQQIACQIVFVG